MPWRYSNQRKSRNKILSNKKLYKLYSSLNIVGMITLKLMRWIWREVLMKEMRNSDKTSVGNLKRRNYSGGNGAQSLISFCSDRLHIEPIRDNLRASFVKTIMKHHVFLPPPQPPRSGCVQCEVSFLFRYGCLFSYLQRASNQNLTEA
jgi:hypothetical protein